MVVSIVTPNLPQFEILLISCIAYIVGTLTGLAYYAFKKKKALRLGAEVDRGSAQMCARFKVKKYLTAGFRGSPIIGTTSRFLLSLICGSVLWCLVLGFSLVIPPLFFLAGRGFFSVLLIARFPERVVIPRCPKRVTLAAIGALVLEVSALLFASSIGINIGLRFFMDKPLPTLETIIQSFILMVVPLHAASSILGSYVICWMVKKRVPIPRWWLK